MQVEPTLLAVALWCTVAWGLYLLRARSPLHLPTIALFTTGLVGSFFPIASSFIAPQSWRNLDYLSPEVVAATQVEYLAFAAGLLLSVLLAGRVERRAQTSAARVQAEGSNPERDLALSAALVAVGFALYFAFVQRVGFDALLDREDFAYKYLLSAGLGPLALGLPLASAGCLWAEASPLARAQKNLFRAVALGICVWSIAFISVRTNAVVLVLGHLAIACERRGFQLRRVRVSLVALLLVLYVALESFALLRGVYKGGLGEAFAALAGRGESAFASAVGGSELSHPFITAGEVLRTRESGELAGRSLVDGVLASLPRGLWPERPLLLSEQFVRSQYAEFAARGGGAAFSLVAEGWLDFGSIGGPLAFGLVLGALLAAVERRRARLPHGIVARLTPYFVFYVAMQHRNEFGTLFKTVFTMALVVVPLWLFADAAATALTRRASPAPARR